MLVGAAPGSKGRQLIPERMIHTFQDRIPDAPEVRYGSKPRITDKATCALRLPVATFRPNCSAVFTAHSSLRHAIWRTSCPGLYRDTGAPG